MYIISIACQTNVGTKPMWSNAHQIRPSLELRNARQNSYSQRNGESPFPFPSVNHLRLTAADHASVSSLLHTHPNLRSEPARGPETLKFRRPRLGVDRYLQNGFRAFRSPFLTKIRLRRLFSTERRFCIVVFQAFGAAGLHACHVLTVEGSPLPAAICIERWVDQVNLQAEVKISGTRVLAYLTGRELSVLQPRILSSQANRLADATFSKSCEA